MHDTTPKDETRLPEGQAKPIWQVPEVVELADTRQARGFSSCTGGSADLNGCNSGAAGPNG